MFTRRVKHSETGGFYTRFAFVSIVGPLLVALSLLVMPIQSSIAAFTLERSSTAALEDADQALIFLPSMVRNVPFTPAAPTLNAISNEDGDGNYAVSWTSSEGAATYTL